MTVACIGVLIFFVAADQIRQQLSRMAQELRQQWMAVLVICTFCASSEMSENHACGTLHPHRTHGNICVLHYGTRTNGKENDKSYALKHVERPISLKGFVLR